MKAPTLGALMSAAVIAACFVDRPSQAFECESTADCGSLGDTRECRGGYCVVPSCPGDCPMCDEVARLCPIECSSLDSCGSVTCPAGWTCTINCVGTGACSDILCTDGSKCTIACTGIGACDVVTCRDACACDLTCAVGTACGVPLCPNGPMATRCTADGTTGTACSSAPAGCTKC